MAQKRTFLLCVDTGKLSQDMARAILFQLQPVLAAQEACPNLLKRVPAYEELYPNGDPDLIIGKLGEDEDIPLGLSLTGNMNCIFAGRAGSGKTTGLRNLATAIRKHNQRFPEEYISIICWDRKGGDYTDFAMSDPGYKHFGFQETLRIGLNAPEGVPPNVWINAVSTVFAARAGLIASAVCLANMMRFLVAAMNPQPEQGRLLWPSFELILDLAKLAPLSLFAAKPDYGKTLIQMLEGITQASGNMFRTLGGLDLERDIVRKKLSCVLDVCGLGPPWVGGISSDIFLLQVLLGRQYRYQRKNRVDCALFMDEADQYAARKAEENFPDLSPLSLLLKQGREYALAVILGLSAIGPTARMILTNASHYFFFPMSDADSLREARQTLFLPTHAEGILPSLSPGECLYRGPGPWPHAMLAKISYIPPSRAPRPERYDSHPFIPPQRLADMPHVLEALQRLKKEHKRAIPPNSKGKRAELSNDAIDLLTVAGMHPLEPVVHLRSRIRAVPPSTQKATRKELEEIGYAEFEEPRCGRRNMSLVRITDAGWKFLRKTPPKRKGRGKIAHTHFCDFIKKVGEKRGHEAFTEWTIPGTTHPVDVAWKINGEWHVFEVVITCHSNLVDHLKTCFLVSAEIAAATIIAPQKRMLADLKKIVDAESALKPFQDRIKYQPIEPIIMELWP